MSGMTKGERQELGQLIRKRERVMKSKARERSATLLAEFDVSSAQIYHWDADPVWKRVHEEAEKAITAAQVEIGVRCRELGIPDEFAPGLNIYWHGRGHNAAAERRAELRRAAKSRIEAMELEAVAKIEMLSLEAQTEVVSSGLESEAAKAFLGSMTDIAKLMPPLEVIEIQSLVETKRAEKKQYWLN